MPISNLPIKTEVSANFTTGVVSLKIIPENETAEFSSFAILNLEPQAAKLIAGKLLNAAKAFGEGDGVSTTYSTTVEYPEDKD